MGTCCMILSHAQSGAVGLRQVTAQGMHVVRRGRGVVRGVVLRLTSTLPHALPHERAQHTWQLLWAPSQHGDVTRVPPMSF